MCVKYSKLSLSKKALVPQRGRDTEGFIIDSCTFSSKVLPTAASSRSLSYAKAWDRNDKRN
jgi:hypothetical protein